MSTQPAPEPGGREAAARTSGADVRAARLCAHVEAYLRVLRRGGPSDPGPHLERAGDLAEDLAPLLDGVRRMETLARRAEDAARRTGVWRRAMDPPGADGGGPGRGEPSDG